MVGSRSNATYSFEDTIQKFDYSIVVEYFISNKLLEATWVNNDGSSLRIAKLKEPYGVDEEGLLLL